MNEVFKMTHVVRPDTSCHICGTLYREHPTLRGAPWINVLCTVAGGVVPGVRWFLNADPPPEADQ